MLTENFKVTCYFLKQRCGIKHAFDTGVPRWVLRLGETEFAQVDDGSHGGSISQSIKLVSTSIVHRKCGTMCVEYMVLT